jgi:ribulose-5-phosphate 4-epimerase/fuculose-1-phosphate aldolase
MATSIITAASRPASTEISAAEYQVRCDLAGFYRLVADFGWDDLLATHISARVPGEADTFLINPYGMLFDEITASSLVKIDGDGNILSDTPYAVNRAGFVIHSAVLRGRPDANCVAHLHTRDGIAVSCLAEGLLPLNQTSMVLVDDIAFHEYEGAALELGERERLQADLGDKSLMFLRNHGTLAVGPSVASAFTRTYFLETACSIQVAALGMNRPLSQPTELALDRTRDVRIGGEASPLHDLTWTAMLRKLDRIAPGYKS